MNNKGLFITLEGPEGSGKTTQAKELVKYLNSLGKEAIYSHEPGGTALSEKIRNILIDPENNILPLTELLLFEASRYQHVQEVILPTLKKGISVVCDRFCDSTLAYQGARNLPTDWVVSLNNICVKDCWPDLTLLLDVDFDTGYSRILDRYKGDKKFLDRIEREDKIFFERLRDNYLKIAQKDIAVYSNPLFSRWRIINASSNISTVQKAIQNHIKTFLKIKNQ